ncbi:ubiquitin-conjugating enzyme/RWD-like protein, partial [Ochromonadaceae sp. CCMP2298]
PALRRIMADIRELQEHPSPRYHAHPLEDNMFEWHFTIRGPSETAFAGGVYHGRILLPPDYPFKPPNIVFLTKNGEICRFTDFQISPHIPYAATFHRSLLCETWQPAWGVRTMLEALISFMPTEGRGAIGALDWTAEERGRLARE